MNTINYIFKHIISLVELFFSIVGKADRLMFNSVIISIAMLSYSYYTYLGESESNTFIIILLSTSAISITIRRLKDYNFQPDYSDNIDRISLIESYYGRIWMIFELFFVMGEDSVDSPYKYKNYQEIKNMSIISLVISFIIFLYFLGLDNILKYL